MTAFPFSDVFTGAAPHTGKPDFSLVPETLRRDLCQLAAATAITRGVTAAGGVSASASYLVQFDNGDTLFVKGSHPGDQSHGAANLRGECAAYQSLPVLRDVAPTYRGMVFADTGDDNGWWLGAWQAVTQHPARPDADAAFSLLHDVQMRDVAGDTDIPVYTAHHYLAQFFNDTYKWRRLSEDPSRADKFSACFFDAPPARHWLSQNLPQLLDLQASAATRPYRLGLMHGDLRCDNLIYGVMGSGDPRWWLIDWANAAEGPLLFDRIMLAASLHAAGAIDVARAARLATGDHPAADYHCVLATMAGYFADQIYRAVPAAMPRLRLVQQAMLWALAALLSEAQISVPLPAFRALP